MLFRSYMQSVCWDAFWYDILTKWENIERACKEYVIDLIKQEFPQPHKQYEFDSVWMERQMCTLMGHRRSEARDAYKEGKPRPRWCEEEIWQVIKEETDNDPNLFQQQVQARAAQSSSQVRHLGSGGKRAFKRDFVSVYVCVG